MPHVISREPRMPQTRHHSSLPTDRNIASGFILVIVKTAANQKNFTVAEDILVKQFKEKLSAHFRCRQDQLVLVFMGRLLKDQDTLSQRGITDGQTVHVVIKSKNGSRSLAQASKNPPTDGPSCQDKNSQQKSSGVCQPTGLGQASVASTAFVESDVSKLHTQKQEVSTAQVLENSHIQQLLGNMRVLQELPSEHPDMQHLIEQNPDISHLLDNSEILWQTLELARSLAVIQVIMQTQKNAQSLENPSNSQPRLGLETIPSRSNVQGDSYADSDDQMFNNMQNPFRVNSFATLLAGQISERVQSSCPPTLPSQKQQDQVPQLSTTHICYTGSQGFFSITSANISPNRLSHTSRVSTAIVSTKDGHPCCYQQPAGVPALPSTEITRQLQEKDKDATISLDGSDPRTEEDLQLSDENTSSQVTGAMVQVLTSHPHLAAQIMSSTNASQLSEQLRQQLPTYLQKSQLADLLLALANPKASRAMWQIEQSLQLLATEAPVLLPCFALYLSGLCWTPASSCSNPATVRRAWNAPDVVVPKQEGCLTSESALRGGHPPLPKDPVHPPETPEICFKNQMKSLQVMGFENYHTNLQAIIATKGNTNAAIHKLKKSQGL
ncbi:LOW QUALITY PROTEIN: ubiquilin-like protein [Ctenodactylus gundi]